MQYPLGEHEGARITSRTGKRLQDITLDEVAYLAPAALDYQFGGEGSFYMLEGETVMGEEFEEFYLDEDALYEMILEIFYEPVELQ